MCWRVFLGFAQENISYVEKELRIFVALLHSFICVKK
jgi:hypothetical protein